MFLHSSLFRGLFLFLFSLTLLLSSSTFASASASAQVRGIRRHIGGGGGGGGHDHGHGDHQHAVGGSTQQLDADDPDFTGVVDFSNAIPGPGGSWCITKTKFVDHMVKDQIKECWHQNVTQCHDTYVTEFLPSQEQKCEESFWKSCKIDFREMPFNYTMKQCHTPLKKMCDPSPTYGKPKIVCKTWFESECNTTFTETTPNVEDKPNTWCKKVPRKICAPDNCKMVSGPEECNDKTLVSTVQKPTEICDLQPQQHCRLITKLTPHLISKEVCKNIPKEVCHLALSGPKMVRKPITLKWCTRKHNEQQQRLSVPSYQPPNAGYLPPPPPPLPPQPRIGSSSSSSSSPSSRPNSGFAPPTYSSVTTRPAQSFQVRKDDEGDIESFSASETVKVTKFPPPPAPGAVKKYYKVVDAPASNSHHKKRSSVGNGSILKSENIFSTGAPEAFKPVFQEQFKPAASVRRSHQHSIQIPESFKQAVKQAGLLEEMEKEGFELVEAREASEEEEEEFLLEHEIPTLKASVDEVVDEELLDKLLSASRRPLSSRLQPVSFTDDLSDVDSGAVIGAHGGDFEGLKKRRR